MSTFTTCDQKHCQNNSNQGEVCSISDEVTLRLSENKATDFHLCIPCAIGVTKTDRRFRLITVNRNKFLIFIQK